MVAERKEVWVSGEAYEPYVGRWSRLVGREFVGWLEVPPNRRWLDVGCGTGALSDVILERASPSQVTGIDPSPGFVSFACDKVTDRRVTFQVGDAQALPVADGTFDAAVAGLVVNFIPDQARAVIEMKRATRMGGVVAAYVWDYLDPAAIPLDEGRRFPVCRPGPLRDLFQGAGLEGVAVRPIDIPTIFKDFDDYWGPFLGGQAPAPSYCISLSEDRRAVLRDRIRASLPIRNDSSIHLIARAWAVRGIVTQSG
jgi:SAM-dependent methyltransferase